MEARQFLRAPCGDVSSVPNASPSDLDSDDVMHYGLGAGAAGAASSTRVRLWRRDSKLTSWIRTSRLVALGVLLALAAVAAVVIHVRADQQTLAASSLNHDVAEESESAWVCGTRNDASNYESLQAMYDAGWTFNWEDVVFQFKPPLESQGGTDVPLNSYWGWEYPGDGEISLTLQGHGSAILNFGNAYREGVVVARLDGVEKKRATAYETQVVVPFDFHEGQILTIKECDPRGMIVINSLNFKCPQGPPTPAPPTPFPTVASPTAVPTPGPTLQPAVPAVVTKLRRIPEQSIYTAGAKWRHVGASEWYCSKDTRDAYQEEAPPWGSVGSTSARTWCATRCVEDDGCVGFLYPFWENAGHMCHIIVSKLTASARVKAQHEEHDLEKALKLAADSQTKKEEEEMRKRIADMSDKEKAEMQKDKKLAREVKWKLSSDHKACEGTSNTGQELHRFNAENLEDCQSACEKTEGCHAIDSFKVTQECILYKAPCKKQDAEEQGDLGASSWILEATDAAIKAQNRAEVREAKIQAKVKEMMDEESRRVSKKEKEKIVASLKRKTERLAAQKLEAKQSLDKLSNQLTELGMKNADGSSGMDSVGANHSRKEDLVAKIDVAFGEAAKDLADAKTAKKGYENQIEDAAMKHAVTMTKDGKPVDDPDAEKVLKRHEKERAETEVQMRLKLVTAREAARRPSLDGIQESNAEGCGYDGDLWDYYLLQDRQPPEYPNRIASST